MLADAVASAAAQTYRPIEIIIVDDGSGDDEARAIDALAARYAEARVVHRENGGPGAARETGRLAARGAYIQYLDSDDLLLPRKLALQVAALGARPEAGVAYGLTRYRDAAGNEVACTWKNANQRQETIFPSFLVSRWWETSTPLYRRTVTDAAGPWLPLRLEEDWEYDCRIGAMGVRLAFVPEVVAEHRDHGDNRLSRGAANDPQRLRQQSVAHLRIAEHARSAGLPSSLPEMQHFARELFRLARLCGASGLADESRQLFAAAYAIAPRWDLRVYAAAARTLGWTRAAKLAALRERAR